MKFHLPSLAASLFITGLTNIAFAQSPLENTFQAFSRCDNSFFTELGKNSQAIQQLAPVQVKGTMAWFAVKNRQDESANQIAMPETARIANIPVLAYQDQATFLGTEGTYYFWGFRLRGKPNEVLETIRPLLHSNKDIQLNGTVYVRSEVSALDAPFRINKPTSGIPRSFMTERVLLIEEDTADAAGPVTKVFCSLQGYLTRKKLEDVRPDLSTADYPPQLNPVLFANTPATAKALQSAQDILSARPLLKPKFKTITYTTRQNGGINNFVLEAKPNGLISMKENYGIFEVERESLAGLFQLKSMLYSIGSGKVTLTDQFTLEIGEHPDKDSQMIYTQQMVTDNDKSRDAIGKYIWNCKAGEPFEAKSIHDNLSGRAIPWVCETNSYRIFGAVDPKSSESHPVFLEDLGIFLPQFRRMGWLKINSPSFSTFEIVR